MANQPRTGGDDRDGAYWPVRWHRPRDPLKSHRRKGSELDPRSGGLESGLIAQNIVFGFARQPGCEIDDGPKDRILVASFATDAAAENSARSHTEIQAETQIGPRLFYCASGLNRSISIILVAERWQPESDDERHPFFVEVQLLETSLEPVDHLLQGSCQLLQRIQLELNLCRIRKVDEQHRQRSKFSQPLLARFVHQKTCGHRNKSFQFGRADSIGVNDGSQLRKDMLR